MFSALWLKCLKTILPYTISLETPSSGRSSSPRLLKTHLPSTKLRDSRDSQQNYCLTYFVNISWKGLRKKGGKTKRYLTLSPMTAASEVFNIALLRIIITSSLKKPQWKQTVFLEPQLKFKQFTLP